MVHRYGNYVIRVLAEQGPEQAKAAVHNTLRKHLVRLARNDKGCTLVDVLLSYGEVTERKPIVQELIKASVLVDQGPTKSREFRMWQRNSLTSGQRWPGCFTAHHF
ncbi:unnamed protein product [Effrenium voratum]|nr:unnamed protein product [Effrenium voratum]